MPGAALALGIEVDQLAGELLGGAPRLQLHLLPLLAAELRERRVAGVGAHVAAHLVQLVARHEHAVAVAELELEVVARHAADRLGLEAAEQRDAVILVHHRGARAQVGEGGQRACRRPAGAHRPAAAQQAVLRHHRQLQLGRDEAVAQARVGEAEPGLLGRRPAVEEGGLEAVEVELGALRLPAPGPRHHRSVARTHQLLELGLRVAKRARRGVGGLGAELVRLVLGDRGQAERRARLECGVELLRLDVEVVSVVVVEARGHVLPVVAQGGCELLLRGHRDQGLVRHQLEQLAEAVDRQHVRHVGTLLRIGRRGDLGQLAVLGGELRRRSDLHPVGLLERALREGREVGEPLHLDVEQLAAHRALLGGRIYVEDVAADRELAALLDLVDALVAARHQLPGRLVEIEQGSLLDLETVRAQVGVRHLLGERDRARDEHRVRVPSEQGIERGDAEPDQVRRRRQVGLVLHAARRVEAHPARAQELPQVGGEVARGPVVPRHHQRGPLGVAVDQAREQVRAQAGRHERALRLAPGRLGQGGHRLVALGVCE